MQDEKSSSLLYDLESWSKRLRQGGLNGQRLRTATRSLRIGNVTLPLHHFRLSQDFGESDDNHLWLLPECGDLGVFSGRVV